LNVRKMWTSEVVCVHYLDTIRYDTIRYDTVVYWLMRLLLPFVARMATARN